MSLGDFSGQAGQRNEEKTANIGKYNYGKRNSGSWILVKFCQNRDFKISNTFLKKSQ